MNSPEVKAFIRQHANLFWYIPDDKKEEMSEEVLNEFIFNYGTLDNIKSLITLLGKEKMVEIYSHVTERKISNYYPEIYNFFSLIVNRYARTNT